MDGNRPAFPICHTAIPGHFSSVISQCPSHLWSGPPSPISGQPHHDPWGPHTVHYDIFCLLNPFPEHTTSLLSLVCQQTMTVSITILPNSRWVQAAVLPLTTPHIFHSHTFLSCSSSEELRVTYTVKPLLYFTVTTTRWSGKEFCVSG